MKHGRHIPSTAAIIDRHFTAEQQTAAALEMVRGCGEIKRGQDPFHIEPITETVKEPEPGLPVLRSLVEDMEEAAEEIEKAKE